MSFFHLLVNDFSVIREYCSILYVGLAHAVPPTNTNFQPLLLSTQVGMPYTNTHKHRTSYFKSTLTFIGPAKFNILKKTEVSFVSLSCIVQTLWQ